MQRLVHFCIALSVVLVPILVCGSEHAAYAPPPQYPAEAKANHLTGSGVFALHIRPDGDVARVDAEKSIGHRILDDAATSAFREWRFHPREAAWVLRIPIRY